MASKTVTQEYLMGIREGREILRIWSATDAQARLDNLNFAVKELGTSGPAGQMLLGERDFWRNQIKKASR